MSVAAAAASWAAAEASPPNAANSVPTVVSITTFPRLSHTWRDATFPPAASGADRRSTSTPTEAVTRPMPRQPSASVSAGVHTGTASISTSGVSTTPPVISTVPMRTSRKRCASAHGRDWRYEPQAHSPPEAASARPASVYDRPRWVTSISGTKLCDDR